jgi:hypothetical protein
MCKEVVVATFMLPPISSIRKCYFDPSIISTPPIAATLPSVILITNML